MSEDKEPRISAIGGHVDDLTITDADSIRIEDMGGSHWMRIEAHGKAYEFTISSVQGGSNVYLDDVTPVEVGDECG
ncbi:hypothetical protein [Gulosibacter molinativorax]|uniref:Uncharacterized protein n=1 Tax=Gulosibacter molinativorax TaxID=256821 RepID=A0ABT7C611_9MICO|nr:hypothetical protein [Gulosibacter molinativorax]MDJ1370642.1 hypothetical protein [Gulosibacter molinativorax]QUY63334.1 Hypotetical protein [Gulosibacter molinativorax]